MKKAQIKTLFVDRDGTLIEDKHYLSDPAGICLLPKVAESLKKIQEQGIDIFIVTNQSGIGRGYFAEKDLMDCQKELEKQLNLFGVNIIDTAFCPHDPSENCHCRKPHSGMWEQLSAKHGLVASQCAMIGDKKEDVGFGIGVGFALSALVATGKGVDSAEKLGITFTHQAQEFSPCLISNNIPVDSETKCISVQNFEDFIEYLLG